MHTDLTMIYVTMPQSVCMSPSLSLCVWHVCEFSWGASLQKEMKLQLCLGGCYFFCCLSVPLPLLRPALIGPLQAASKTDNATVPQINTRATQMSPTCCPALKIIEKQQTESKRIEKWQMIRHPMTMLRCHKVTVR